MNKTITQNCKKTLLAILAVMAFALNASAGSTFYAYYVQASSYPTANGAVYLSEDYAPDTEAIEFQKTTEYQFTSTSGTLFLHAQPAAGYLYAGVSQGMPVYDETGAITGYEFNDEIISTENPASLSLSSDLTDNPNGDESVTSDSATVAAMMPLDPNNVFYALFAKVVVNVPEAMKALGSASISKVCNDKGDEVTITATPADDCTFVNWTDEYGNVVSTNAEYTFTVGDETATYTANFDSPNLVTLNFPKEGGYISWNDDVNDITLLDGMTAVRLTQNYNYDPETYESTPVIITDTTTLRTETSTYQVSCQNPYLLYGYGKMRILKAAADPDYIYVSEDSYMRWSGNDGATVSDLDENYAYYTIDLKNLALTTAVGTIPAKTVYVAIPKTSFENNTPLEYINLSEWYPQTFDKGDVNEDGTVDISDVNSVINIICGGE